MLDVAKIRQDFPMLINHPQLVYFDSAATSFKPYSVLEAVSRYYTHSTSNVHRGDYFLSYQVSKEYEDARGVIAELIDAASAKEIVFTSGASAALNMVAFGYAAAVLKEGDVILTSEAEHASNLLPWFRVAEQTGAIIRYIPLDEKGRFSLQNMQEVIDDRVKIVALAAITNVLGYRVPMKEVCHLAHRHSAVVSVDGAQSVPHLSVNVVEEDIDFLSFSSHKMCGPSGVGVLYGKMALLEKMTPLYLGGGMNARFDRCGNVDLKDVPYKFESGTPNIEGVLGLAAAAEYLMKLGMDTVEKQGRELSDYFFASLKKLENVHVYNEGADTGIITFTVEGIFSQDVAAYLSTRGIAVRSGNHCAKILHNIVGTSDTVRASLYFYNTKEEIDKFITELKDISIEKCIGVFL